MPLTLRVDLPDSLRDPLTARATAQQVDLEKAASLALAAAVTMLPAHGTRVIVLDSDTLQALEGILAGGSVLNQQDLLQKVQRLAGITYGNIRFNFTPGQLEEIQDRAARLSLTPEELVRRTVKKMEELFFTHLGVGNQGG